MSGVTFFNTVSFLGIIYQGEDTVLRVWKSQCVPGTYIEITIQWSIIRRKVLICYSTNRKPNAIVSKCRVIIDRAYFGDIYFDNKKPIKLQSAILTLN